MCVRAAGRGGAGQRVMYSYQSFQSSAAADKQKCEGQLRCRGLIDMAGAQRITHTDTQTHTFAFCCLRLCKYPQMHHLVTVCSTFSTTVVLCRRNLTGLTVWFTRISLISIYGVNTMNNSDFYFKMVFQLFCLAGPIKWGNVYLQFPCTGCVWWAIQIVFVLLCRWFYPDYFKGSEETDPAFHKRQPKVIKNCKKHKPSLSCSSNHLVTSCLGTCWGVPRLRTEPNLLKLAKQKQNCIYIFLIII